MLLPLNVTPSLTKESVSESGWARSQVAVCLFSFLLSALYLWYLSPSLLNVPRSDDLRSVLPFVDSWRGADSGTRWHMLFEQYFSHRIFATRLFAIGVDGFFGHLQLVAFHALGLALWLGIVVWLVVRAAKDRTRVWTALPVALLLLQPTGLTNISVAMQSPQNLGVLALALAVCRLAPNPGTKEFTAALLLALLAIGTSANGLALAPILVLASLAVGRRRRALVAFAAWAICAGMYFRGYVSAEVGAKVFNFGEFFGNTLAMLGSPYDLNRLPVAFAQTCGLVSLIGGCVAAWVLRGRLTGDTLSLFALFLLVSTAMCAIGRIGWGAAYMGQDRYSPYGLLFAVCVWLCLCPAIKRIRQVTAAAVVASAAISAAAYAGTFASRQESRRWDAAVVVNQAAGGPAFVHEIWGEGAANQDRAYSKGVWHPPSLVSDAPGPEFLRKLSAPIAAVPEGPVFKLRRDDGRGVYLLYSTRAPASQPSFAVLVSETETVLLPAISERETYLHMLLGKGLQKETFEGYRWSTAAPTPGRVRLLGLAQDAGGVWSVRWQSSVIVPERNR